MNMPRDLTRADNGISALNNQGRFARKAKECRCGSSECEGHDQLGNCWLTHCRGLSNCVLMGDVFPRKVFKVMDIVDLGFQNGVVFEFGSVPQQYIAI